MSPEEVTKNIEDLKIEIAKLESDLASFAEKREELIKENKTKIDEKRAYLEDDRIISIEEVKKLRSAISIERDKFNSVSKELNDLISKHHEKKSILEKDMDEKLTILSKDNEKKIKELKKEYDDKTKDLQVDYEAEEAALIDDSKKTLSKISENLKRLDSEYKSLESEIKAEQTAMIDNYNRLIEEESVKKDALTSKSSTIHNNQRAKQEALDKKLDELLTKNKAALEEKKKTLDEGYEKMKEAFDKELERQKAELLELTKRKTELSGAYTNAYNSFEKEKESLIARFNQESENIDIENKQLADNEKKANDELLAIKESLAKKESELQAFKVTDEKEYNDLEAELEARRQDLIARNKAQKPSE